MINRSIAEIRDQLDHIEGVYRRLVDELGGMAQPVDTTSDGLAIRSCPFCGGIGKISYTGITRARKLWIVTCPDCLTEGPSGESGEQAVKLWNRRWPGIEL